MDSIRNLKRSPGHALLYSFYGYLQISGLIDANWANSPTNNRLKYIDSSGWDLVTWKSKR